MDDPQQWPFCLADDEFAASCRQFFGGDIPKARKLYQSPSVASAIKHDVEATVIMSAVAGVAGLLTSSAFSASEVLRIGGPALATNVIGVGLGAV